MKRILLYIIIISSLYTLNSFAQTYGWIYIGNNIPGDSLFHDLSDVYFINDNEGWITSSSHAEIYHTTDGGEAYEVQSTQLPCNAIWMLNENEGYCGGASGFVYRTTDGGTNWNFHGTIGAALSDITFPPTADTGYACGDNGAISSITSWGVTPMSSGVPDHLSSISFPVNNSYGKVCGGSIIMTYVNGIWGGASNGYPSGGYYAIYMVDNLNGWAAGDKIIHTIDGSNWTTQTNPDTQGRAMADVFFLSTNEGWIVGNQGLILNTTNGGTTWTVEGAGLTTSLLRGVHFTSATNGYVVGNDKTLIKFGEITSVENEDEQPKEFSLLQNYPNPFNPSTNISFIIPQVGFTSLKVYDVLGNEIETLVNEEKPTGEYDVEFNGNGLTSGIYFYQLKAGNFIETKKMVLMK